MEKLTGKETIPVVDSGSTVLYTLGDADILVEAFMTNPVRPGGFAVRLDGKVVAILTYEKVAEAIRKFDELKAKAK